MKTKIVRMKRSLFLAFVWRWFLSITTTTARVVYDHHFGGDQYEYYLNNNETEDVGDFVDPTEYWNWLDKHRIPERYDASVFLPATSATKKGSGAAVHWKIAKKNYYYNLTNSNQTSSADDDDDDDRDHLYLAVAAPAKGFVGFGLSQVGGMLGSDIVYWEAADPDKLTDAHVLENFYPIPDDCQDWTLIHVAQTENFIMFQGRRLLETGDTSDWQVLNDRADTNTPPRRVVAAWGDSSRIGYHGNNVARGMVRFFFERNEENANVTTTFRKHMQTLAEDYFDTLVPNYTITEEKTQCFRGCMPIPATVMEKSKETPVYLVGFESLVTPDALEYVHHFFLMGCHGPCQRNSSSFSYELIFCKCDRINYLSSLSPQTARSFPNASQHHADCLAYTPGTIPWAVPSNLGWQVGEGTIIGSLCLECHYNNIGTFGL